MHLSKKQNIKKDNVVRKNTVIWEYLCLNILILIGFVLIYQLWRINIFKYPMQTGGDATQTIYGNMLLADTWVFGYSERISYPYYAYMSDFPNSGLLLNTIRCLIFKLIKNPALAINGIYISGYLLAGSAAYWALRKLKVERLSAGVGAILYTFLPFHLMRGINHLTQGMYWPVPIFVYFLINYMKGNKGYERNEGGKVSKDTYLHIFVLLYLGGHSVYYTFFSCFFMCVLILWMFICQKNWKLIKPAMIDLSILLGSVMVTLGIYVINVSRFGGNSSVAARTGDEIELYGLKIGHLLLPITEHRLAFLRDMKNTYNKLPLNSENHMATLGVLISIGFILLLVELVKKKHADEDVYACSVLNIAALLLSTIGGVASIISLFFTKIRCYNRISIYIAFFAVICFCKLFNKLLNKIKNIWFQVVVSMLVLAIGIFDQTTPAYVPRYENIIAMWDSDSDFIQRIEAMEEEGAKIYQMPYVYYPEAASVKKMNGYDHTKGYMHSDTLVWSFGAYKGRIGDMWNSYISTLGLEEQVYLISFQGFDGIYVDSYAYSTSEFEEMIATLKECTNIEPIISNDKRLYYFSLCNYDAEEGEKTAGVMAGVIPMFGDTFYSLEKTNTQSLRWCSGTGQITITNTSEEVKEACLSMQISTYVTSGTYTMDVYQNAQLIDSYAIVAGKENKIMLPVELLPGDNEFIFDTNIPAEKPKDDTRNLAFYIKNFSCRMLNYKVDLSEGKAVYSFAEDGNAKALFIKKGLFSPEGNFSWTDGREIEMYCDFGDAENVYCEIATAGMLTQNQKVIVEVNGEQILEDTIEPEDSIWFSFKNVPDSIMKINLYMPEAISPYELGGSEDKRELAFMLKEISFSSDESDAGVMMKRIKTVFGEGAYNPEAFGESEFRWCATNVYLNVNNKTAQDSSVILFMDVFTYVNDGEYTLDIYQNGQKISSYPVYAGKDTSIVIPVELKAGVNEFKFISDIPAQTPQGDDREIAFGMRNFRLAVFPDKVDLSQGPVTYAWDNDDRTKELYTVSGISAQESNRVWTIGKNVEWYCDFGEAERVHCEIKTDGMLTETQKVIVEVNGEPVLEEAFYPMESICFSFTNVPNSITKINLYLPEAVSPYELGINEERRELSFLVEKIIFSAENE